MNCDSMSSNERVTKKPNVAWERSFVSLGILAAVMAFGQSILQIIGLRLAAKYLVIPYIWFFCLDSWATIIYGCYTVRLLYLVRCERSEDLSRIWWYSAVMVMVINPAQSIWWWSNEDHILLYVSVPASVIYIIFFVLVCRSLADGKASKRKRSVVASLMMPLRRTQTVTSV